MASIYLDHNATTPVDPVVAEAMALCLGERYGNPSSMHGAGRIAREAVEQARNRVADSVSGRPEEIVFVSGGTEANNLAIRGSYWAHRRRGRHLITTPIEHHSVLEPCRWLEREGLAEVTYLPVDAHGMIDPSDVERAIRPETILVSVMHANNEVGTMQPVEAVAEATRRHGVLLHVDAVQTWGKVPWSVETLGADLVSLSAHKCYGPKGIGALWVRRGTVLTAQQQGGHQERNGRGGTESVAAIVGFGAAAQLARERLAQRAAHMLALEEAFWSGVRARIDGTLLNGHPARRVPGTVNVAFDGVDGDALMIQCDLAGLCVSLGAACEAGSSEPSHVLLAMGVPEARARASLRFSIGCGNTHDEIERCVDVLADLVMKLRARRSRDLRTYDVRRTTCA